LVVSTVPLLVSGVRLPRRDSPLAPLVAQRLGIAEPQVRDACLVKLSLDARKRPPALLANVRVELSVEAEREALASGAHGVRRFTLRDAQRSGHGGVWDIPRRRWSAGRRPIVVGAGPAGLFAAMRLAESGAEPLLLERGAPVPRRRQDVAAFWARSSLNPESNVVYGEGGAGTFSDGKLFTRLKDGRVGYVLSRLVAAGADPAIMVEAHPHIGTDRLRRVLVRFREQLESQGAELRFGERVTELLVEAGRCVGVRTAGGQEILGGPVILATGSAAEDSARAFLAAGMVAEPRPFAIGVRIEHPRVLVDEARHGQWAKGLPAASYRLVAPRRSGRRQAYTFCMCPGGMVIPASEHGDRVVVNGMSSSQRASRWSNAALVAPVGPADFGGEDPLAGFRFRGEIERRAWAMGGTSFAAPAQRAADLLRGIASTTLPRCSYPHGAAPCDLRELLPAPVIEAITVAIEAFERDLPGFGGQDAVLLAPETRTASPIRFLRDEGLQAVGLRDVYPVGEGLGWGGGIVSAAVDGLRGAEAVEAVSASSP
jgi:uncharacterized FAD-dependent dehydrogenase